MCGVIFRSGDVFSRASLASAFFRCHSLRISARAQNLSTSGSSVVIVAFGSLGTCVTLEVPRRLRRAAISLRVRREVLEGTVLVGVVSGRAALEGVVLDLDGGVLEAVVLDQEGGVPEGVALDLDGGVPEGVVLNLKGGGLDGDVPEGVVLDQEGGVPEGVALNLDRGVPEGVVLNLNGGRLEGVVEEEPPEGRTASSAGSVSLG